jgi:glycosyltransferase involved in cell wall biosynthesis
VAGFSVPGSTREPYPTVGGAEPRGSAGTLSAVASPSNTDAAVLDGLRVLLLNWRDTGNPEGGGAELFLDRMAHGLVARGCRVTFFSAAYPGAAPVETVSGVQYLRRGSKLTVYPHGLATLLSRRWGRFDVVVDVQNGMPFLSRAVTRRPVVVLVHHVHREQWQVVYPGLIGRIGWFVEGRLAPWLYRRCQYVAVSQATREELAALRVDPQRISVVHNGTDPLVPVTTGKSPHPTICVVGRLVPHKQVEHAIVGAVRLRGELPDLRLHIVGAGWWQAELERFAAKLGAGDTVVFEGHVSEPRKQELYERSWVMALPSLKEGWGLVVGEAGRHETPTVAYRSAGGTRESIADGRSGLLVDTQEEFTAALRSLLTDSDRRALLGAGARQLSNQYTWAFSQQAFAEVLASAVRGRTVDGLEDEGEPGRGAEATR